MPEFTSLTAPLRRLVLVAWFPLLLVWIYKYNDGFNEEVKGAVSGIGFSWHPFLMTIAFLLLFAEGSLAFRTLPGLDISRGGRKVLHMSAAIAALVVAWIAFWAIIENHRVFKRSDFYTVHGTVGLICLVLATLQFLGGFIFYWLLRDKTMPIKASFMPSHKRLGRTVVVLGAITVGLGLAEKQLLFFVAQGFKEVHDGRAAVATALGVLLLPIAALYALQVGHPARDSHHSSETHPLNT
eukprot:TRINITY_DN22051_c0_g1_i1.p1 TRINITY_DN22051_c0_g1~~TRINITY_DN22051_c0_g1_i1.p1  ORF type:complete len:256 (+),score=48.69 TRINITY_DN22051_c0_g1_i1:50-769(+)